MSYFSNIFGALTSKKDSDPFYPTKENIEVELQVSPSYSPFSQTRPCPLDATTNVTLAELKNCPPPFRISSDEESLHDALDMLDENSASNDRFGMQNLLLAGNSSPTLGFGMYDVLFASGNFAKGRLGNIALTQICNRRQKEYDSALKGQQKTADGSSNVVFKSAVLKKIVLEFKSEYPNSKIWTKRSDNGSWQNITDDVNAIMGKLQYKLCRKKDNRNDCPKRKACETDEWSNSSACKRTNVSFASKDSVTLCRVIIKLQRENEMHVKKIKELENEISCLKASAAMSTEPEPDFASSVLDVETSNNGGREEEDMVDHSLCNNGVYPQPCTLIVFFLIFHYD